MTCRPIGAPGGRRGSDEQPLGPGLDGSAVASAPVRLDSLGQEIVDARRRVAALPNVSGVVRRLSARPKAS